MAIWELSLCLLWAQSTYLMFGFEWQLLQVADIRQI